MVRFLSALLLAVAMVTAASSAHADIQGNIGFGHDNHGGGDWGNHGGGDWGNHGGGHDGGGWGNGHDGGWNDNTQWMFKKVDRNGCINCEVRADQWRTRGCQDLRAYDHLCNRRTIGLRLACRQPNTVNNDFVYVCTFR